MLAEAADDGQVAAECARLGALPGMCAYRGQRRSHRGRRDLCKSTRVALQEQARHLQEENKRLKAVVDRLVKHQLDEGDLNARVSEVKRGLKAHGIADIVNGTHEHGSGCALAKVRPLVSEPTRRALRRHKAGGDVARHGAFQLESKGTTTCEVTRGEVIAEDGRSAADESANEGRKGNNCVCRDGTPQLYAKPDTANFDIFFDSCSVASSTECFDGGSFSAASGREPSDVGVQTNLAFPRLELECSVATEAHDTVAIGLSFLARASLAKVAICQDVVGGLLEGVPRVDEGTIVESSSDMVGADYVESFSSEEHSSFPRPGRR